LGLCQRGENAAFAHQFVERATLHDAAPVKHEDAGRIAHGGETVGVTKVVRPFITSFSAAATFASVAASSALVASSKAATIWRPPEPPPAFSP
jgi:hypothetical protein